MAEYVYPAMFREEVNGSYSVEFPDIDGCYTGGDNLSEAMEYAEDALALMILDIVEEQGREIPKATPISALKAEDGCFPSLIKCDTDEYSRKLRDRKVRKTLTIPGWLNDAAMKRGLDFSQVFQEALKQKLEMAT